MSCQVRGISSHSHFEGNTHSHWGIEHSLTSLPDAPALTRCCYLARRYLTHSDIGLDVGDSFSKYAVQILHVKNIFIESFSIFKIEFIANFKFVYIFFELVLVLLSVTNSF